MKQTFDEFMKKVDEEMNNVAGHTHQMISDFRYRDHYDDGFEPRETAIAALIEEFGFQRLNKLVEVNEINCTYDELCECC